MRKMLVEYSIISGNVVETRRTYMELSERWQPPHRRAVRVKGRSTERKILANEQEAVKRLARVLNCNFKAGDLWATLRYSDDRLPGSLEEAKEDLGRFLRKCRDAFRKETGGKLRYAATTSQTAPRNGGPARLHHHIVMDRVSWEIVCRYWPKEQLSYSILDGRQDYTGIARYMVQNATGGDNRKRWSCSQGLEKPIITEPIPVADAESLRPPRDAEVKENILHVDEETGVASAYIRYVIRPAPPKRGGRRDPDQRRGGA